MKQTAKTLFSLLLVLVFVCQFAGLSSVAWADNDAPADKTTLNVEFFVPDHDDEDNDKAEDQEPLYKSVSAKDFDEDSGLAVSFQGVPEEDDEDEQNEEADSDPVQIKASVGELRENGLFINPPEGFYVSSLYISAESDPDLDDVLSLTQLATASAQDASLFLPAEIFAEDFEDEDFDSPVFIGKAKSYSVLVTFDELEEDEIEVSYESGELEFDAALPDAGDGSVVASVPEAWVDSAEAQGYVFSGWLLIYANGSSVEVESGEEIAPYANCTLIAQWSLHEPAEDDNASDGENDPTNTDPTDTDPSNTDPTDTDPTDTDPTDTDPTNTDPNTDDPNTTTPDPIVITYDLKSDKVQKVYDGKPLALTGEDLEFKVDGNSADVYKFEVEISYSESNITDAASVSRIIPVQITIKSVIDPNGNTLDPSEYSVTPRDIEVSIAPRPITISGKASKVYDGKALELDPSKDLSVTGDGLVDGHKISSIGTVITMVNVDDDVIDGTKRDNAIHPGSITILDASGNDVTKNYHITGGKAELTITPLAVTVSTGALTKVYDATPLTVSNSDVKISEGTLPSGYTVEASFSVSSRTDAGKDDVTITSITIKDANGADVTRNFNISREKGSLEVTKRPLTIETAGATKVYDGKALTNKTTPTVTGRLDGHQISLKITGSQTKVGSSDNTISDLKITDTATKTDVTKNYEVTYKYGKLTVTDANGNSSSGSGSSATNTGKTSNAPSTGDESNAGLWIGLMVAALVLIGVIVFLILRTSKKKDDSDKN